MLNVYRSLMFRQCLSLYPKRYKTCSTSPSIDLNVMLKKLIDSKQYRQALDLFDQQSGPHTDVSLNLALKASTKLKDYQRGIKIHRQLSSRSLNNHFIQTSLIHFYMQCHDVENGTRLFTSIANKSNYIYGAMFKGLMSNKMPEKVLDLFNEMKTEPDRVILILLLSACAQLADDRARRIGNKLLDQFSNTIQNNNTAFNSAIHMLMRFGDVTQAEYMFTMIKKKDTFSYGIMINGYVENEMHERALNLFEEMPQNPEDATCTNVFTACTQLANDRAKTIGKNLLGRILKNIENNQILLNSALHMLMKFGDVANAEHIFEMAKNKDVATYGGMMKGYVENNMHEKALDLFQKMPLNPDDVIYIIVFTACAQLANDRAKTIGNDVLNRISKNIRNNENLLHSAIHMLMKFGDVTNAEHLFQMINKTLIAYGNMMKGYNLNNKPLKCLTLFQEMKEKDIIPNEMIFLLLISACSQIGVLSICQSIVSQIPLQFYNNRRICNSLINMWGKAGSIENAERIYRSIENPDVYTYTGMINAFGLNHKGLEAVEVYRKTPENLRDEVLYICVLNACSHSGLIDQAHSIFKEISNKTERIVAAMVDCLSRLFSFDEAQNLIDDYEKSNAPSPVMYTAILSGARNAYNSSLSEKIYKRMKCLFPDDRETLVSGSILLSNIYSSLGDYQKTEDIRLNRIKEFGTKIQTGVTWTEVNGKIVEFQAHDRSHPQSKEIHAEVERMSTELIQHGHKYDSSWITRRIGDGESVESILCGHSEKLAIAFNFIQNPKPSFIQITKNLRVCGDCHRATKLIAKIRQCKIIVRDANCIHHFYPNGTCSCQDHF